VRAYAASLAEESAVIIKKGISMAIASPLATALRTLRTEETRIQRELDSVRGQIRKLSGVTGGRGAGKRGPGRPPGSGTKRKLSPAGRAAMARAAKKRWAAWRKRKAAGK
jgi:hypothetical protein